MKLLGVDTSGSAGSIVLSEDDRILGEVNLDSDFTHTGRLLSGIDYLLKHTRVALNQIEAFGVVCGPGSFTGVRIGLTTVKGLAETLAKPTVAITTFEAWVERFPDRQGTLVPMIDARRGEVYASVFERRGALLVQRDRGFVGPAENLLATLDRKAVLFLGGGARLYGQLIRSQRCSQWQVADTDPFLGRSMAAILHSRVQQEDWIPASELRAYYLRRPDAELKWRGP